MIVLTPIGFVSWGAGDTLAELFPDGSWRCTAGGLPDSLMADNLLSCYGRPAGDPAAGEFGPRVLAHLADKTGGVWVSERMPRVGLIH